MATVEQADFANHRIPGLEGTVVQDMGRHSVRLYIEGIYYGDSAKADLETLRAIYKERAPIDFLADIVGETYFSEVLIEAFEVQQRAKAPEQFSYRLRIAEYVPPPEPLSGLGLPDIDTSILDDALDFMDALELPDLLSLPEFSNPLESMGGMVDGLGDNMAPISDNSDQFTAPNVFSDLNDNIQNGAVDSSLGNQSTAVSNIQTALTDLSSNPSNALSTFSDQLGTPSIDTTAIDGYAQSISAIQSKMPSDIGNVVQPIADGISGLQGQIQSQLADSLGPTIRSFESTAILVRQFGSSNSSSGSTVSAQPLMVRMMNDPGFASNIGAVSAFIDSFPGPVNVEQMLLAIQRILNVLPRDLLNLPNIPYVDELTQVLETAINWRSAGATQIAGQIEGTLAASSQFINAQIDQYFQPILTPAAQFQSQFNHVQLDSDLQNFVQQLTALRQAIQQNQTAAIQTALSQLPNLQTQVINQLATLQTQYLETSLQGLSQKAQSLPQDLEGMMDHLIRTLAPDSKMASLTITIEDYLNRLNEADFLSQINEPLENMANQIGGVLGQLDLSILQGPIAATATQLSGVVDDLENAKAQVVAAVSLLFDELEALINQIDLRGIIDQITQAIQQIQQQIQTQINQLFAPIRQVISQGIAAIDSAIDSFDPSEIVDSLRGAIQTATGALTNPDVLNQLEQIKGILQEVSEALDNFSFKVVNDLVIEQIDKVTQTLKSIDLSKLNDLLKGSLKIALDIVPKEAAFNALRGELVEKVRLLVEEGPIKLLDEIKDQPALIRQQLEQFSPANLLGDALSQPFNQIIGQMDAFSLDQLLQPAEQAISQVKNQIIAEISPAQLLAPVEAVFNDILSGFDQLNPAGLIAPLQSAITQAIDLVIEVLPVDEFFDLVNEVLSGIQSVFGVISAMKDLMEKLVNFLTNFDQSDAAVDAWVASILSNVDGLTSNTAISNAFDQLRSAIQQTRATDLSNALMPGLDALIQLLTQLSPQSRLNELVLHYQNLRALPLDALDGASQAQVQNFLNNFDPLGLAINRPLNGLQQVLDQLLTAQQALVDRWTSWDTVFHAADAPLTTLVPTTLNDASLRQLLSDTISRVVTNPIKALFRLLQPIQQALSILLAPVNRLFTELDNKIGTLINGPASLTAIRDALQALVDKIRSFNLDFLTDELNGVFDQIKSKLEDISPGNLIQSLDQAFQGLLDNLSLSQLLPQSDIDSLNQSFEQVKNKLQQLDPGKLIIDIVQPEFEQTITPFLEAFDLSELLKSLNELLERLQKELDDELKRTQTSFTSMLQAIPFQ
ncbi:MAG: hypothetical protein AAFP19_05465 [Bacteroidota bacterium]